MNKTNIDWPGLEYTSNPGYGCKRNCFYCYARELHNKRRKALLAGAKLPEFYRKPFEEIQYFPERLKLIKKRKKPSRIFIGSMSDVCYWDEKFIRKVLKTCGECPQHTFMFLTKSPEMLNDYDFLPHDNIIVGATITGLESHAQLYELYFYMAGFKRKFLSIEPLMGGVSILPLSEYEHVIVGAMTGSGAIKPKTEWINSIKHPNIYYKQNIKKYL